MNLIPIDARFIDAAWKEGAHNLSRACDVSGGEITGDQLKLMLARGERTLLRMQDHTGETVGWGVVRIDQLPNMRVLFITDLYAPGGRFERFYELAADLARAQGCSRVRCAAKPAQERLYRMKAGFVPVYVTMEREVV